MTGSVGIKGIIYFVNFLDDEANHQFELMRCRCRHVKSPLEAPVMVHPADDATDCRRA